MPLNVMEPKAMKMLLVNPPQFRPFYPPMGLALVAAMAKREGLAVEVEDLNLRSYEHFLSPVSLAAGMAAVRKGIEECEAEIELDFAAQQKYRRFADLLPFAGDDAAAASARALAAFRNIDRFRDYAEYRAAFNSLNRLLSLGTAQFHPAEVGLMEVRLPVIAHRLVPELLTFAADGARNPYRKWMADEFSGRLSPRLPPGSAIGITLVHPTQFIGAFTLALTAHEQRPDLRIVMGGPAISTMAPELCADTRFRGVFDLADAIVVGEAEEAFPNLCRALAENRALAGLPNTICRASDGALVKGEVLWPRDLSSVETPDYSGFPLDRYLAPAPVFTLQLTRGCHWGRCIFCDYNLNGPTVRYRPLEKVMADIRTLQERHNARYFYFADSGVPPNHLLRLADALIADKVDINWSSFSLIRPELDAAAARKLKTAGCRRLMFGLESAVPETLKKIKKGVGLRTMVDVLEAFAEVGIPPHIFIIFGFPGEGEAQSRQTLDFIKKHRLKCYSASVELFTLNRFSKLMGDGMAALLDAEGNPLPDPFATHCDSVAYISAHGYSYEEARMKYPAFAALVGEALNDRRAAYWPLHDIIYFANNVDGQFPSDWDRATPSTQVEKKNRMRRYGKAEGIHQHDLAFDLQALELNFKNMKEELVHICCRHGMAMEEAVERFTGAFPRLAGGGSLLLSRNGKRLALSEGAANLWRAAEGEFTAPMLAQLLCKDATPENERFVAALLDRLSADGFLVEKPYAKLTRSPLEGHDVAASHS